MRRTVPLSNKRKAIFGFIAPVWHEKIGDTHDMKPRGIFGIPLLAVVLLGYLIFSFVGNILFRDFEWAFNLRFVKEDFDAK